MSPLAREIAPIHRGTSPRPFDSGHEGSDQEEKRAHKLQKEANEDAIQPEQRLKAVFAFTLSEFYVGVHMIEGCGLSFPKVCAGNSAHVFEKLSGLEGVITVGLFENADHAQTAAEAGDNESSDIQSVGRHYTTITISSLSLLYQ
jgi:hypothetical protein